jgi:hypothetical protein
MICDKNACSLGCGAKYTFFMVKERKILQEISGKYIEKNQSTNPTVLLQFLVCCCRKLLADLLALVIHTVRLDFPQHVYLRGQYLF